MSDFPYRTALIVGAGPGISSSVARQLSAAGVKVGMAARNIEKLAPLASQNRRDNIRGRCIESRRRPSNCSRTPTSASANPTPSCTTQARVRPDRSRRSIRRTSDGLSKFPPSAAFLVTQQAARRMTKHGRGAILLTGATAGVKGFPLSAAFAMGKFALRGLAQSAARELGPKGNPRRALCRGWRCAQRHPARYLRQHARSRRHPPRPIWMFCGNPGAPGRWRSKCGRGPRNSDGCLLDGPSPAPSGPFCNRASRCPPLANRLNECAAPVAQLDRALPSEGKGHTFESCRVRHICLRSYWSAFVAG